MAYVPHTLVALGGGLQSATIGTVSEIWECTLRVTAADGAPIKNCMQWLRDVSPAVITWFGQNYNSNGRGMAAYAGLYYMKANNIGADGKYESPGLANRLDFTVPQAGGCVPTAPAIMTLCYSWRTDLARGPGSHGRIYFPNATGGNPTDMAIPAASQAGHLDYAHQFLQAIMTVPTDPTDRAVPVLATKGSKKSGYTNGANVPITHVMVGNIWDTQRRRKDALVETYLSTQL